MKYVRLYPDQKGETHFADVNLELTENDYRPPAPVLYVSHAFETEAFQFVRLPAGWSGQRINPPEPQFFICLKGSVEITASDGQKRTIAAGDAVKMEDVEGKGHRTSVKGADDCIAAVIPVA
jgi:quercetin dioxygenase-like cupin family protein